MGGEHCISWTGNQQNWWNGHEWLKYTEADKPSFTQLDQQLWDNLCQKILVPLVKEAAVGQAIQENEESYLFIDKYVSLPKKIDALNIAFHLTRWYHDVFHDVAYLIAIVFPKKLSYTFDDRDEEEEAEVAAEFTNIPQFLRYRVKDVDRRCYWQTKITSSQWLMNELKVTISIIYLTEDQSIGVDIALRCAFCFKQVKLLHCARCKKSSYCGKSCQQSHWKDHKPLCKPMDHEPKPKIESLTEYFRSVPNYNTEFEVLDSTAKGRMLVAKKDYHPSDIIFSEKAFLYGDNNTLKLFDKYMQLHKDPNASIHPKVLLQLATNSKDYTFTAKYIQQNFTQRKVEEVAKFVNVVETNGMSGGDNETGLFLLGSMLNHSCTPNAQYNTWGDTLYLCAIEPIKAGDEVTISYSPMYLPTAERRKILKDIYGFTCICPRCTTLPDLYRTFVCFKCGGEVCPIGETEQWKCLSCKHLLNEEEKASYLKAERECISKQITLRDVPKVIAEKKLHKTHYLLYNAVDKEIQFLVSGPEAVMNAKYLIECAKRIPELKGTLSSLYYLLSSGYRLNRQPRLAKEALKKVWQVRQMTNGKNVPKTLDAKRDYERFSV